MYRLQEATKTYLRRGTEIAGLRAASLQIDTGEYIAITGPSGSGKTTLLSMLGGMLSPTSGQVWFGDCRLYDLSATDRARLRRQRIGFVFQTFNLVPYLSAIENVQVPLYLAGVPRSEQWARAATLLGRVGLAERMDHKPRELSTGQQQRVALARTLANEPELILADEPTGNLDPDSRQCVLDFLDGFHRDGRTIVVVTHDTVAAGRAQRHLRLVDGRITTTGGEALDAA